MPESTTAIPTAGLPGAIERCRGRLWALCYRLTGHRADADDLTQETIARAIEREAQLADTAAVEGWLFRIATTVCLDHLRRHARVRRVTDLVDPVELAAIPTTADTSDPSTTMVRREDLRFAVVVALQALSPRQRAVLVLHDVCDRPLAEVAETLGSNPNATKAVLHRARAALARARQRSDLDPVADAAIVDRFARAIETRAIEDLAALCTEDVWGVVDGGGVIPVATRPSVGRRAVARRFANALRRLGSATIACAVRHLNGEPAVLVMLPDLGGAPFATVHLETRVGTVQAIRVVRDPVKLAPFAPQHGDDGRGQEAMLR
jgi:RNA polymerase sigma-70 factor (ECF subfamily)